MKKWLLGASALVLAGCSETVTGTDTHANTAVDGWSIGAEGDLNNFFDCLEAAGATLVAAHRGGPAPGFPENAIETMAATLSFAPALMEIDVATSADGVLFLNHDDTLERTTTGEGPTGALAWTDIARLNLEDNDGAITPYHPSRFDEALAWAEGKTILEIDFKKTTSFEAVAAEISRQHAEDRVIVIAYTMAQAEKLHRLLPDTMISLSVNSQSELNRAVAAGIPDDRIIGFTGTEEPRPRLFTILNNRDVEVIFATLGGRNSFDKQIAQSGDDGFYAELAEEGVDIIATDRPRAAQDALAQAGRAAQSGACGITKH